MRNKIVTSLMIPVCLMTLSASAQEADKIIKEISDMEATMSPIVGASKAEINAKWKIKAENQSFELDAPTLHNKPFPDSKPLMLTKYVPEKKEEIAPRISTDAPAKKNEPDQEDAPIEAPLLVESNFHGYNIVRYSKLFYGVDLMEGALDVSNIKSMSKHKWFSSDSLSELKAKIEKEGRPVPTLLMKIKKRLKRIFGEVQN